MNDLLPLKRMSRRLELTQEWLRDQADSGKIPCLKAGNRYLFNPAAVEASLASQAAKGLTNLDKPQSEHADAIILLLKPQQAAKALEIGERKLWSMTASGEIPHVRLGRCVRYPVDELRAWLSEKRAGAR